MRSAFRTMVSISSLSRMTAWKSSTSPCPDSRARSSFRAVKPLKPSRLEKRTTAAGDEAQAEAYSLAFIWMTSEVWSNR